LGIKVQATHTTGKAWREGDLYILQLRAGNQWYTKKKIYNDRKDESETTRVVDRIHKSKTNGMRRDFHAVSI
jgi:hypothetical protein